MAERCRLTAKSPAPIQGQFLETLATFDRTANSLFAYRFLVTQSKEGRNVIR